MEFVETLKDPLFWLNFVYFLIAVLLACYIPGSLILRKVKLNSFDNLVLSLVIGIVFWIWQGFIFGFLGVRQASYIYLLLTFLIWIKNFKPKEIFVRNIKLKKVSRFDLILILITFLGTSFLALTTFLNGVEVKNGLYFCCGLPDSLYQLALTNQLIAKVPPIEPGASGIVVYNYHYLGNLMVADLIRVFHLPLISTQYQYIVIFFSTLLGLLAFSFTRVFKLSKKYTFWLLIFLYFSGDIIFLLTYLLGRGFDFSIPFLHHAGWLWISPSRVFAAVIFFGGLAIFSLWIKKKSLNLGIILALIFSVLIGIKIYVGIFSLVGLCSLAVYFLIKREFKAMFLPIFTLILALIILFLTIRSSGSLDFTGLWRFENFISTPQLGLIDWELKRQTYIAHGNLPRIVQYALTFIAVYFIFVFGTLNLGFFQTKKSLSLFPKELNIFLISGVFICLILGSFFIQDTGGANSSQFLITVMIILSIYAALSAYYWVGRFIFPWKVLGVTLIIMLTVPRTVNFAKFQLEFQRVGGGHYVKVEELKALNFLKTKTPKSTIVLVDNIDKNNWRNAYSNYISFLSSRQIFLDGKGITADHGVNVNQKLKDQTEIFQSSDSAKVKSLLSANNISYIYMKERVKLSDNRFEEYLTEIFSNTSVSILKVKDLNF